jgi:hypothetical protein
MSTMNMPGFTAGASLYNAGARYRTGRGAMKHAAATTGTIYPAAQGQDFPDHKCTCKGCASGGGDLTGQCASVCKDKTVYDKGSEPNDYCKKAARPQSPAVSFWRVPGAGAFLR